MNDFKTCILKRVVHDKQLEITRRFDLDNIIDTATDILKDNKINLIIIVRYTSNIEGLGIPYNGSYTLISSGGDILYECFVVC
ncbi:hypothetical protein HGQ85_01385 [Clostridioides difficile]|nr:hypothetical protein [Clostridioides difficile]